MELITHALRYLFSARPDPNFHFTKLILAVVILMVLAGILIRIMRTKWVKDEIVKKMLKRYPDHLFSFAIALLVLLLFREAGIPLLSMRIWWVGYLVIVAVWAIKGGFKFSHEYRSRKSRHLEQESIRRYLPGKKNK
jgi:hypothetical protein